MNIPARYCTGYLGDIGMPPPYAPMDFAGWFEAYLGGRWYTFDARNNIPRIGRVLIARGRDAADVPITTHVRPEHARRASRCGPTRSCDASKLADEGFRQMDWPVALLTRRQRPFVVSRFGPGRVRGWRLRSATSADGEELSATRDVRAA